MLRADPRRAGVGLVLALAVTLALAASADAGTVGFVTATTDAGLVSTVRFTDAAGDRNDVTVKLTATQVHVTDRAIVPQVAAGCALTPDPATVACPLAQDHPPLVIDVQGGAGDDALTLLQPDEPDTLDIAVAFLAGGDGNDTITQLAVETSALLLFAFVNGDGGDDRLVGGPGDDILAGGAGKDTLAGAGGHDDLDGDGSAGSAARFALALAGKPFDRPPPAPPADDVLDGGTGEDRARYTGRTQPLRVDLADPAADGSAGEADRLTGIEGVAGGNGPNTLLGDAGPNSLQGSRFAADVLDGRGGDDRLLGAGDGDTLLGGAGDDLLQRPGPGSSCGTGRDTLLDPRFAPGVLMALRYGACERARSLGGIISIGLTPVRLRRGAFTIQVATALPADPGDEPVRFAIVTGSGRTVASRAVRIGGMRGVMRPLKLRLRGRPPSGSKVRVVMREPGIAGRSLYVELRLAPRA